jgi:hypothetical protein
MNYILGSPEGWADAERSILLFQDSGELSVTGDEVRRLACIVSS